MRTSNQPPPKVTGGPQPAPPEETFSSLDVGGSAAAPHISGEVLTPLELEENGRLEAFLDELLADAAAARGRHEPPPDLTARVLNSRPFAPWEVRHARSWRVPVYAAGGLLAAGAGVSLTPLFTLGPGTAVAMWSDLLAVSLAQPVSVLLAAAPRLAEGFSMAMGSVPGTSVVLGASALLSAGALVLALRRTVPSPSGGRSRA